MKKKLIITILALFIVSSYLFYRTFNHTENVPYADIHTIIQGDIVSTALAIGKIEPRNSINVKSRIPGTVDELHYREGAFVNQGETLLSIKPNPTPKDYTALALDLERKKLSEQYRQEELERQQTLFEQGVIPANHAGFVSAREQYKQSLIERELAEKTFELQQRGSVIIGDQVIESTVTSPVDGYILKRNVDVGDSVTALTDFQEGTILMSIANMNDMIFKGSVSEVDAGRIAVGMDSIIQIGAIANTKIDGTLAQIALHSDDDVSASTQSSTRPRYFNVGFEVEIDHLILPTDSNLRSGYSATADIIIAKAEDVIIIPERFLVYDNELIYTYVTNDEGKTYHQTPVETGLTDGINTEISNGLSLGDTVVELSAKQTTLFD